MVFNPRVELWTHSFGVELRGIKPNPSRPPKRTRRRIKKRQLTVIQFEEAQKRNIGFFQYLDAEKSKEDFINITSIDLQNIKSKALIAGILFRFDTTPVLSNLKSDLKGMVLIGIKSLIECFEKMVNEEGVSRS